MKRPRTIIITITLLCLFCGILAMSLLPWAATTYSPSILKRFDLDDKATLRVDTVTPYRTIVSGFLGNQVQPSVSLPRVAIHYSPKQIVQGKISSVDVEGATINLQLSAGKLFIRDFEPVAENSSTNTNSGLPVLPIAIDELRFTNCRAIIHSEGVASYTIPFDGTVAINTTPTQKRPYLLDSITIDLQIAPPLSTALSFHLKKLENQFRVRLSSTFADLSGLQSLRPSMTFAIDGQAELDVQADLSENLLEFNNLSSTLIFNTLNAGQGQTVISANTDNPLTLVLQGSSDQIDYSLSGLHVANMLKLSAQLAGNIKPSEGAAAGTGTVEIEGATTPLKISFKGKNEPNKSILNLVSKSGSQQLFTPAAGLLQFSNASLDAEIAKTPAGLTAKGLVDFTDLNAENFKVDIEKLSGEFSYQPDTTTQLGQLSGKLSTPVIRLQGEGLAKVSTQFSIPSTTGRLQFYGSLIGVQENPIKLLYSGSYDSQNGFATTYAIENTVIDPFSLPSLIAIPPGLDFSGEVSASGNFSYGSAGPDGHLNFKLNNGMLSQKEKKISVTGLATEIDFDHLPILSSRKNQILTVNSIDFGTIHVNNGTLHYRVEDDTSLFIEKSRFNWCGGKVEMGSTRITLGKKEFATTLYCDRLQFADLLSQFGISDTDGDGSLNGRLPVEYASGRFVFDDGFLFSTPGNSGIVRFNNTDMLKQSLPDMNQAAYLDYSIQSLENFSYNWTKLTFNSVGDDLLISMQIDGKPAVPLPYGYRKGHLVKKTEGTGLQHPLRLDVNFHLPFGEMFRYGQSLQEIMENM